MILGPVELFVGLAHRYESIFAAIPRLHVSVGSRIGSGSFGYISIKYTLITTR